MSYENDNEERRLFDQIVLQTVDCGSNEPPERIATRVIDARRAYFAPAAALESRPDAAEVMQRVLAHYEGKGMPAGESALLQDIARRAASLTGPKKPTKPALKIDVSGDIDAAPLELLQTYIRDEIEGKS